MNKWEEIEKEFQDEESTSEFGNCENCGCELDYMPNGGWGVGYVCVSCAMILRGEGE